MDQAEWTDAKRTALAEVERLRAEMAEIAHDLHEHPETGWDTPRSAGRLADFLARHGFTVERQVAGLSSSFRAYPEGRFGARPAVLFLAEYDALEGLGHACGHNLIGTASAAAGIALARAMEAHGIRGGVYVMGTPFEEGGGGKIVMLREGVMDVGDFAMMWHPGPGVSASSPNIAAHMMTIAFSGRAAHSGGRPEEGVNAADAAMITFVAVNALRQHVTPDVRIHGIITKAGDAPNIVPDKSEIRMIVRALDHKRCLAVVEKVRNCARAGALATGCQVSFEDGLTFYERVVVESLREVGLRNLELLGYRRPAGNPQTYVSGDGGNVSHAMPHLGIGTPIDPEARAVPHTPEFARATDTEFAFDAMTKAAQALALSALDVLTTPGLLETIRAEHREKVSA